MSQLPRYSSNNFYLVYRNYLCIFPGVIKTYSTTLCTYYLNLHNYFRMSKNQNKRSITFLLRYALCFLCLPNAFKCLNIYQQVQILYLYIISTILCIWVYPFNHIAVITRFQQGTGLNMRSTQSPKHTQWRTPYTNFIIPWYNSIYVMPLEYALIFGWTYQTYRVIYNVNIYSNILCIRL